MITFQKMLMTAYREHYDELIGYCFCKVNDMTLSEDLVQTTFMKAFMYLRKNGKIDVMRAFLFHVLRGLVIDEYRKNKSASLDLLIDKGFEPKDPRSDRSLDNAIDARSSALFIEKLPEAYREVIRMRYLNDMSLKEISVVTKQSPNNVAVRVHRGLDMLRKLLVTPHASTVTNKGTDITLERFWCSEFPMNIENSYIPHDA